jgi:hypothetical protein
MVRGWKDDVVRRKGEIYSYSSPGFWLSGFVVEELSGKRRRDGGTCLQASGMNRTTCALTAMTYATANGHNVGEDGKPFIIRPFYNNVAQWPCGIDLFKYRRSFALGDRFLNDATVDGADLRRQRSNRCPRHTSRCRAKPIHPTLTG